MIRRGDRRGVDSDREIEVDEPKHHHEKMKLSSTTTAQAIDCRQDKDDERHEKDVRDALTDYRSSSYDNEREGPPDDSLLEGEIFQAEASASETPEPTPVKQQNIKPSILWKLVRIILMDIPFILMFGTFMALCWVRHVHDHYLLPQLEAVEFTQERAETIDQTYYTRSCNELDMSTLEPLDLFLPTNATPQDAYNHQLRHGFTVFPRVLSRKTASDLRTYFDERNRNVSEAESNFIIESEHRYSFNPGMEVPEVAKAMQEITRNTLLKDSAEKILGRNPALIELSAITSSYGAINQYWHYDVDSGASPLQYARAFGPSYSIFIMLQDTTKNMGATGVCPGAHYCARGPLEHVCEQHGFQLVQEDGYWHAGDALLMNLNSWHRGSAHTDPSAQDRVMLIVTFVPRPRTRAESRQMSQCTTFSLRWDQWGHTWNDLMIASTEMQQPWTTLRALGLYKKPTAEWGIDYATSACMRISNEDNGFRLDELVEFVNRNGGFKLLPRWLHGHVEDNEETTWEEFLFETLELCKAFVLLACKYTIVGYVLLCSVSSIVFARNVKGGIRGFGSATVRLAIMAGAVLLLYKSAINHVDKSQWASDIRNGLRYTPVFGNSEESEYGGPLTWPHRNDVLVETRYKSRYLNMYNDYMSNHPGNRLWNELVDDKVSTFASYSGLPSCFRRAVADYIVGAVNDKAGRFLYQTQQAHWAQMSRRDSVDYTRKQLVIKSNPVLQNVMEELEFLISEEKYGPHRQFAMTKNGSAPFLIYDLKHRLMAVNREEQSKKIDTKVRVHGDIDPSQHFVVALSIPKIKMTEMFKPRRPIVLAVGEPPEEPEPNAWLHTGDFVNVKYKDDGRWWLYKATLMHVFSSGNCIVEFHIDDATKRVKCKNLERYTSPMEGEYVQVLVDEDLFRRGHIVNDNGDGTFYMEISDDKVIEVNDDMIRRLSK